MSANIDNLKIIYNKIYELSVQIETLIDKEIYTELVTFNNKKEDLINKSDKLLKKIIESKENTDCFKEICLKIHKQEQKNIEKLAKIKDSIREELKKTSQSNKILKAYTQTGEKQGSILDCRE